MVRTEIVLKDFIGLLFFFSFFASFWFHLGGGNKDGSICSKILQKNPPKKEFLQQTLHMNSPMGVTGKDIFLAAENTQASRKNEPTSLFLGFIAFI